MVEKLNEPPAEAAPKKRDDHRDWLGLLYEHEAGTPICEIAARLNLTERWVKSRLLRESRMLPPGGPARLAVKLTVFLEQAETRLGGDPVAAEKTARAVLAMTKAAEAVAAFAAQHHTAREAGANNDYQTRRAALEAKIARLLDAERTREGAEGAEGQPGD